MRSVRTVVLVACLVGGASQARAASPVLASVELAKDPVRATYGDLMVRLSSGPEREDGGGANSIAEIASPQGKLRMVLEGEESPSATARIVRLAAGEPQVLVQRAAVGSAACVESKLAILDAGAWRAIDLDRVCEAEGGYDVLDIDGDGVGELVSKVGYFEVFADHAHTAREPIRIQRLVGGRLMVATGAKRFRAYLRKSLPGRSDTPPAPEPSVGGTSNYSAPAAWMATKALLGETRDGWAAMAKAFGRDKQTFEVCAVREVRNICPKGRTVVRPFLQAIAMVLVADNYVKGSDELRLP